VETSYGGSGRALLHHGTADSPGIVGSTDRSDKIRSARSIAPSKQPVDRNSLDERGFGGCRHGEPANRHRSCFDVSHKTEEGFSLVWRPFHSPTEKKMTGTPRGDVFSEMQGCLEQGIGGRPSLARFVEVTYEAILELRRQIEELRARRPRLGLKQKRRRGHSKNSNYRADKK
jgi:hypothetical protein